MKGASFCLFIFSREYFTSKLNISDKSATNTLIISLFACIIGLLTANSFVLK